MERGDTDGGAGGRGRWLRRLPARLRADPLGMEIYAGSALSLALRLLGMAAGYVFVLAASRRYGARGMGVFGLSLTVLTLAGVPAGLGFGPALLRLVPQHIAEGRAGRLRGIYRRAVSLVLPAALAAALALGLLAPWAARRVFADPDLLPGLVLAAFLLPLFVFLRLHVEIIRGLKHLRLSEYLRQPNAMLAGAVLLLVVPAGRAGLASPFAAFAAGVALSLAAAVYYVRRRLRTLPPEEPSGWTRGRLVGLSSSLLFAEFMTLYLGRIETFMIGWRSTTEAVGVYEVAFKLAAGTSLLLGAVNTIMAPKLSELFWSGRREELARTLQVGARLMFWTSAPVLAALVAAPRFWLGLFGPEFTSGARALVLIAAGQFVNSATGSVGAFLNMTGRQRILRNFIAVALALNVAAGYVFIPRFGIDAAAAACMLTLAGVNVASAVYVRLAFGLRTYYLPFLPPPPPPGPRA